jgi:type IV secretory pathway VirB2 component (pilin)
MKYLLKIKTLQIQLCNMVIMLFYTRLTYAAGYKMPWESPLCAIAQSASGSTIIAIATIAFAVGGAAYLWGEELAGITKKLVNIIVGVSIALGGGSIVTWLAGTFGVSASCSM